MAHDEEFLIALVTLHGGTIWRPEWLSADARNETFIFDPGWNEHSLYSDGHFINESTQRAALMTYIARHNLLPDEVAT